jgi:hypothetical protein
MSSGQWPILAETAAELGEQVYYETAREYVSTRVEEDGYHFSTSLKITGAKDRPVDLNIFSASGAFLGHRRVVPPYESTSWDKLKIFVPYSRLKNLGENVDYTIYVVEQKAPNKYIERADFKRTTIGARKITWDWRGFDNDETHAGGTDLGFVGRLLLRIAGYKGTKVRVVGLVRNEFDSDFPERVDGPFRIDSGYLSPPFDETRYDKLEMFVPYKMLGRLSPAEIVTLTPAIEVDGKLYEGNVHFRFLAGGTLNRVERLTKESLEADAGYLESLRRRMDSLRGSPKP